jgi:hypothetical protein
VTYYQERMRDALVLVRASGAAVVIALQPSLLKKSRSRIEDRLLELSLDAAAQARVRQGYARIRAGLRELARAEGTTFADCSNVFGSEPATTFTDLWHFADPGHALLADHLAPMLLEVFRLQESAPAIRPGT